jgi:type I restriction enzyme S subunit
LVSDQYQDYIQGASGGTTRKSASAGVVTGTDIIIPPKELMDQFEEKVSLLRSELNNLLVQNSKLRQSRDLLLPKLVCGKIGVK